MFTHIKEIIEGWSKPTWEIKGSYIEKQEKKCQCEYKPVNKNYNYCPMCGGKLDKPTQTE